MSIERPLSKDDEDCNIKFLSPNSLIKKDEFFRLISQALREHGYNQTANMLEKESGIIYEEPNMIKFRESIFDGDWKMAESLLCCLEIKDNKINQCLFLIRQQKYLELLEHGNVNKALIVLRKELTPLQVNLNKLYELSNYLMCTNIEDIKKRAKWNNLESRNTLLNELQKYISPSVMIPKHRLETLVEQSLQFQKMNCLYHNTNEKLISLFTDHKCLRENLPKVTTHILNGHSDEVWNVCFSPNGKYLASGSKDSTTIIWDTTSFQLKYRLYGHTDAISNMYWSPDGTQLLTCSNDKTIKLWDIINESLIHTYEEHTEGVTSCAWLPCGTKFVSGSLDKCLYLWNVDGKILHQYPSSRVTDIAISKDGTRLVTICYEKKIRIFNVETGDEINSIQETDFITSLYLSNDSRYALLNLRAIQEIHLWDLEEQRIVQKYSGQKQGRFVIRSCFGGLNQTFIASGSEDYKVYIWNRKKGCLISSLSGHTASVNSVAWHPTKNLLVSASDDNTIRCWENEIKEE
ncbi:WD40 repeat-like protein [Piromyces finnis]|uniref:WD40 repeat-like protein n=1 Tax=Piromyces finnis TaxID=1754191 RepID=A0A1Y1UXT1_9FUNG|nr:WD40 repeat-like protein [Piromyces finnis]|eukprot:ORX43103.1 WD40 repeat-like protein [Piromyces finnis]